MKMKKIRAFMAMFLCILLVLNSILPSWAMSKAETTASDSNVMYEITTDSNAQENLQVVATDSNAQENIQITATDSNAKEDVIEFATNSNAAYENAGTIASDSNAMSYDMFIEQLLESGTVDEMYALILAVMNQNPELLWELTYNDLERLKNLAYSLNDVNPMADYEDLFDTLLYLQGELDLNGAVALPVGNDINGNKVYFASSDNVNLFSGANDSKMVEYDSGEDAFVFEVELDNNNTNDPMLTFNVENDKLLTKDYKYIAITYKTSCTGRGAQLYLLTTDNNKANATYCVTPQYDNRDDTTKYRTVYADVSAVGCWSDTISSGDDNYIIGFRFDYFGSGNTGDKIFVESIAFCKDVDHANYMKWERETLRGATPLEFYAAAGMELSFSAPQSNTKGTASGHNVVASYDESEKAIKLVVQDTNCTTCHRTDGHNKPNETDEYWGQAGADDAFDPQIRFDIPGGVTNKYRYVVITYMCKDMYLGGRYIPGENKDGNDWYDDATYPTQDKVPVRVGLFPQMPGGGYHKDYERNVQILEENVYYSVYIDLADENQRQETQNIRFDPFNVHFAEEGATLYLASVIFCDSLQEAEEKVEEQLKDHPYGYNLTFDKNTTDDVTNMPQSYPIYTTNSTHTYQMADYSRPTRAHYTFSGWKDEKDDTSVIGETYTITGKQDDTIHEVLYAHWVPSSYSIVYELNGGSVEGNNPSTYTIESDDITLINPTRENYTFRGWTGTDLSSATMSVTIKKGSTGNRTYTAVWEENTITLHYVAVGPSGEAAFGEVKPEMETVSVVSGIANGSTAEARHGFRFIGWYDDDVCTHQVSVSENYIPAKTAEEIWKEKTYYAKFDYGYTDLTISTNCSDKNQGMIIEIMNYGETVTGENIHLRIVLMGSDSKKIKHIPYGTYVVKENSGWAWRYDTQEKQIKLSVTEANLVLFKHEEIKNKHWLSGESICSNWWEELLNGSKVVKNRFDLVQN